LAGAVAGDAVARPVEAAELLDVDVDEFAGVLAFVAPHRLGRFERLEAVEPEASEDPADGGGRHAELGGGVERQLPGGDRPRKVTAPFHGARTKWINGSQRRNWSRHATSPRKKGRSGISGAKL